MHSSVTFPLKGFCDFPQNKFFGIQVALCRIRSLSKLPTIYSLYTMSLSHYVAKSSCDCRWNEGWKSADQGDDCGLFGWDFMIIRGPYLEVGEEYRKAALTLL